MSPVWSQDGQQIDFVYGAYGYAGLNEDTSPDGQRIAFVVSRIENDQSVSELYVKNADGAEVTKLTTAPSAIWGIDW
jgi:Tol biopolymer transport system component